MNEWSAIVKRKLANLIRSSEFECITSINPDFQILKMKSDYCRVDKFGRVDWSDNGKFE